MSEPAFPKTWKKESQPHQFCPGCGQALALKTLGYAIDALAIQDRTVYATDIGCSLLSWNMFDFDTIQTHHGRAVPVAVGFKLAKPQSVAISLIGDGGGYAIGVQHLINSAMRNDKITVILINNANYAMTGGQLAPTTLLDQKTDTTPLGRKGSQGSPLHGPEMLAQVSSADAYIARGLSNDFLKTKEMIKKAVQNQLDGRGFSFLEILSMCPVNWKTDAKESVEFIKNEMAKVYPIGEIKCPEKLS